MLDPTLIAAAEGFAQLTRSLPDARLERDWHWRGLEPDVRWGLYRTYEELRDLATLIVGERVRTGRSGSGAQRILAQYQLAYRDLKGALLGATEDDVDRVPAVGEWPLRGVLGHMNRAEVGFLGVTTYALMRARSGNAGPAQAPDDWFTQYDRESLAMGTLAEIVTRYDRLHQQVLDELIGIPDEELGTPVTFWYEADVRFQLLRFDAHVREHTIQTDKVLELIKPRPGDGERTARLIYQALGEAEGAALGAPDIAAARCAELAQVITTRQAEIAATAVA